MKLAQLTESVIPPKAAAYLKRQGVEYTTNMSGEITIKGDFRVTSTIPGDFPKIDHVLGNFKMDFPSGPKFQFVPAKVGGDCWIRVKPDTVIKSSQLPRSSTGAGRIDILGLGNLIIDDDTICSYIDYVCVPYIIGGLNILPRHFEFETAAIGIKDNLEGIPPSLKGSTLNLDMSDGSQLKNFHRRFTSFDVKMINLNTTSDAPLLWLLRLPSLMGFSINMANGRGYTVQQSQELKHILYKAKTDGADIFDVQQQMVDAGFGKNAKL